MPDAKTFDYIIAGAGSAGCVLANRLSEDADATVCLIEAGPRDRHPYIHIPLAMIALMQHPTLSWRFGTTPQTDAGNRVIPVPRGKTLGGSSAINGMVYIRGHPRDYDDWAAAGNPGWSYADVLPYFRRSEGNAGLGESPYHGSGGPLSVIDPDKPNPLNEVFQEAAESLQFSRRRDFNDDGQDGFGVHQLTQKRGRRHSTATAFLDPVRHRPNLEIITGANVNRVMIEGGRAVGIEIQRGGQSETLRARREVVLSSGAIGSPAILMRSGIGPGNALQALGLNVAHDAPGVGANLQDHMGLGVHVMSQTRAAYGISVAATPRLIWSGLEYLLFRRGLIASNVVEGCGFVRTDPSLDRPDIQFGFMPAKRGNAGRLIGYGHGFAIVTILLHPKSRGQVGLRSADPMASPDIDLAAFSAPEDLETFLAGYKLSRRLLESPAFAPYRGREWAPGGEVQSDDDLRAHIRKTANTIYHPVGTCRMGSDAASVVDPELRVRGVDGLRVADASIMPTIVGGNTNAPTIMIGEKAADMIRGRTA